MRYGIPLIAVLLLSGCADLNATEETTVPPDNQSSNNAPNKPTAAPNETYENPVDRKTYVAEGGWKTYSPDSPRDTEEKSRIHTGGIRLLTAQNDIAARTSVKSLAAFAKEAEKAAQESLGSVTTESTVLAQFTCTPTEHTVELAHQGAVTEDALQTFYDRLLALDKLPVASHEVSFQLEIRIGADTQK